MTDYPKDKNGVVPDNSAPARKRFDVCSDTLFAQLTLSVFSAIKRIVTGSNPLRVGGKRERGEV
jgi:hypothetical protein